MERDPGALDADAGIHDVLRDAEAVEDDLPIEQDVKRARSNRAKLMGHSSPMVTLSIYTGLRDDEIAETGEALRKALGL